VDFDDIQRRRVLSEAFGRLKPHWKPYIVDLLNSAKVIYMGTQQSRRLGRRVFRTSGLFTIILSLFITLILFSPLTQTAGAQSPDVLAATFAPVLHFTRDEKFYPTSVDYIISSSVLKQRLSGGSNVLVNAAPTNQSLGSYTSADLFLDNKLSTLDAIAADYSSKASSLGYYVYVHVVSSGSSTVIQYWLFFAYNNGPMNNHQGDIEVVEVFLDSSDTPQEALYSQHGAGENAAWGDVEKTDNHPVVYVAQGSHANYFRPYQGKIGIENDIVGSDGKTIQPNDLNLIMLGEQGSPSPEQGWLDFAGRWGYWGTDEEVALGRAGPLGPVQNQDGIRWAQPQAYLDSTFSVNGTYFILAWLVANFLLILFIYLAIRGAWKVVGIVRLHRKGGLLVKKFLKSHGSLGLILGIVAILITVAALFLPWYTITASSQAGPLAQQGGVTLMTIDGINGLQVNLFLGPGGESTSGYSTLFFMQVPFAILIGVGIVFLALDIIGVKSGKSIGLKFILGAITSLLPFILIFVFIMMLPSFLPYASSLVPGQTIPPQVDNMVRTVAVNPVFGTISQQLPVVGTTTVNWGFAIGAYLLLVAAVIRIIGGVIARSAPELQQKTAPTQPPETSAPPPPPQSSAT